MGIKFNAQLLLDPTTDYGDIEWYVNRLKKLKQDYHVEQKNGKWFLYTTSKIFDIKDTDGKEGETDDRLYSLHVTLNNCGE